MIYRLLADLVLIVHLAFMVFVVLGGLLVMRWPRLLWWHLAAVLWGAAIEFIGFICPLTPLETSLRTFGGDVTYKGDFIDHYVTALIYPSGLTRSAQIVLGLLVVGLNLLIYGYRLARRRRSAQRSGL